MQAYSREEAIRCLWEKAMALRESGEERYPKRADFTEDEVSAIKAYLGPWPRALEKAGLKKTNTEKQ
jgi:hypothetical protein